MEENICVFGDSITWGAVDNEKGGWVNRLWLYVENNLLEEAYIFNLGIPGDTTEGLLKRIESECFFRNPKKIVIAIGINDTEYFNNNPYINKIDFQNNIEEIIEISEKFTKDIIFVGLTPVIESIVTPFHKNETIKEYDKIIESVCNKHNKKYAHVFDKLDNNDIYSDGIHLTPSGHKKIFECIKQIIF